MPKSDFHIFYFLISVRCDLVRYLNTVVKLYNRPCPYLETGQLIWNGGSIKNLTVKNFRLPVSTKVQIKLYFLLANQFSLDLNLLSVLLIWNASD